MTINEDPMFKPTRTALPYNGTTGYAGSDTSRQRAEREADDGVAQRRQRGILALLKDAGPLGRTVKELRDATGEHHGQVSGALSTLHADGQIVALRDGRRNGCGVYVLPQHRLGRLERPFRPNKVMTPKEQELFEGFVAAVQRGGEGGLLLRQSTGRSLISLIRRLSA